MIDYFPNQPKEVICVLTRPIKINIIESLGKFSRNRNKTADFFIFTFLLFIHYTYCSLKSELQQQQQQQRFIVSIWIFYSLASHGIKYV